MWVTFVIVKSSFWGGELKNRYVVNECVWKLFLAHSYKQVMLLWSSFLCPLVLQLWAEIVKKVGK
ncbi:hypothetical protein SAMN02745866_03333 [Alteromonadaceae bacterium Bs31]|nr:hypothetical protein SAMN02745866_03333 [Alteromonadaceae bacterium Bs31]